MKKKLILGALLGSIIIFAGFSFTFIDKNEESGVRVEAVSDTNDKENLENESIEINDENIDIIIPDDNFITVMDSVFDNLPFYSGKRMKVEGIVANVSENNFSVIRLYDMEHDDHTHEVTVGINVVYEGEIPQEETWVEVIGTIDSKIINGNLSPILKVEKIEKKFSWGQAKVYN